MENKLKNPITLLGHKRNEEPQTTQIIEEDKNTKQKISDSPTENPIIQKSPSQENESENDNYNEIEVE